MNKKYIFDLVITEDDKYMIFMDELFINKSGISLGSIWENTYIFNEMLSKNLGKPLCENIEKEFKINFNKIRWEKEQVQKWLNEINEDIIDSGKELLNKGINAAKDIAGNALKSLFMKGIVPTLRWYRKNSSSLMGTAADTFFALFPLTAPFHRGMWIAILALDVYEMIANDYDEITKDSPFLNLAFDSLNLIGGAVGSKTLRQGMKPTLGMINTLKKNIPSILTKIKDFVIAMGKNSTSTNVKTFMNTILKGLNGVFEKFIQYLKSIEGNTISREVRNNTALTAGTNYALTGNIQGEIKKRQDSPLNYI